MNDFILSKYYVTDTLDLTVYPTVINFKFGDLHDLTQSGSPQGLGVSRDCCLSPMSLRFKRIEEMFDFFDSEVISLMCAISHRSDKPYRNTRREFLYRRTTGDPIDHISIRLGDLGRGAIISTSVYPPNSDLYRVYYSECRDWHSISSRIEFHKGLLRSVTLSKTQLTQGADRASSFAQGVQL